jgi:serine/threonine protein kinase
MNDPDKTIPPPEDHENGLQGTGASPESNRETIPPKPATVRNNQDREEPEIPPQFGRYEIIKLLGQGAMGSVYLAMDKQLDRKVALKVPQMTLKEGSNEYKRFYREAQSAGTLRHANICPVYDVGDIDGVHYICMAYIEGRPLSEYINTGRKISQIRAATVIRKMAIALEAAHQQGIIHRDLKPENVIIDRAGEPIITDFGLAHRFQSQNARLTQDGALLGSPGYMSPEQVEGDTDQMDPRSDVYSLGVLFFEFLAGRLPFEGTTAAVLGQIIAKEPPLLSEFRRDVYPDLESICLKMIQKNPENRYQSMKETAIVLSEFIKKNPNGQNLKIKTDTTTDGNALTPPDIQQTLSPVDEGIAQPPVEEKLFQKSVKMHQLPSWLITIGIVLGLLIVGLGIAVVSLFVRMGDEVDPGNRVPATVQTSLADKYTFWIDGKPVRDLDQLPVMKQGEHLIELKDSEGNVVDEKPVTVEEAEGIIPSLNVNINNDGLKIVFNTDYSATIRGMIDKVLDIGGKVKLKSEGGEPVVIDSKQDLPSKTFEIIHFDLSGAGEVEETFIENLRENFPGVEIMTPETE